MQESSKITTIIQEYNLEGLLKAVVKASKEGFELDFETVSNYPIQLGTAYLLGMVKSLPEVSKTVGVSEAKQDVEDMHVVDSEGVSVENPVLEEITESKPTKKAGRPSRKVSE